MAMLNNQRVNVPFSDVSDPKATACTRPKGLRPLTACRTAWRLSWGSAEPKAGEIDI